MAKERAARRAERAGVAQRETGFASGVASFIGAAGGVMLDPPVLGSMAFGAPAATSILRAALTEAAAAGAGTAAQQLLVQAGRIQFGEQPSLGEALANVGAAAGGALVLTPIMRGVGSACARSCGVPPPPGSAGRGARCALVPAA